MNTRLVAIILVAALVLTGAATALSVVFAE